MLGFLLMTVLGVGLMSMPLFEDEDEAEAQNSGADNLPAKRDDVADDLVNGDTSASELPDDKSADVEKPCPGTPSTGEETERTVRNIRGITPQDASDAREVFALKSFPSDRPELEITLTSFDPADDLIAYSLTDLATSANADLDDVHGYTLSSSVSADGLRTEVTLSLFLNDAPDTAASVQKLVLEGVTEFDPQAVSVVSEFSALEQLAGGERAGVTEGSAGHDILDLNEDDALVLTGDGADTLTVSGDRAVVEAGAGSDVVKVNGNGGTIDGGDGTDEIWVTGTDHVILGGAGADTITTKAGNTVFGGTGADMIDVQLDGSLTEQPPLLGWTPSDLSNSGTLIELSDGEDTVALTFDPDVAGTLHRLDVKDYEYIGGGRSEASYYTLVVWTPDASADLDALTHDFEAYAYAGADPSVKDADADPLSPRILATIKNGSFSYDSEEPENNFDIRHDVSLITSLPLASTAVAGVSS